MANGSNYVDAALTSISQAWLNQDSGFIAGKIFPEVLVPKKTFKIWEYDKSSLRVPSSSVRTGRSRSQEATYGKSTSDYGPLQEHSLSDFIERDELLMTDSPLNAESDAVENLNHVMALIDEKDLATTLSDTAVITQNTTLSGTSQFSDYANSDPFAKITTAATQIKSSALRLPNTVFMGWEVWMQLINHPDLLDRTKWSQLGVVTGQTLLAILAPYGIKNVYIGKASENSAAEGQTDSLGSVWGKNLWLGYVTDRPSRREVNGGYKFRLEGGREVTREEQNNPPGVEIVNRDYYDYALLAEECFYLIKNAVA